ncbi:chorismate synthase [Herbinix hemicellulosilytica]|uniref:Chorismate synthase n=1 Tax=Herbinix hemicellulosilytica TaxID=1564487 RepID=A0A0H5SIV1_HERHM|nr:chorismate synthase [Herbinix hemicellulosilytica]RBP59551.1 chorismate synthase [Herbinix hemicellulosilytica]CRZ34736.1 Chorismate synthase [Herbinix hemicellulosilytica]
MSGSIYGKCFTISTWGESHGEGYGVVIDGCPAGLPLDESQIQAYLKRRKPGQSKFSTPRKEEDKVRILSGVFEGKTTGTPISLIVFNENQRSSDYSDIASYYRPGHADYTYDMKYGFRDYRGGGRSSGRETISRVAAGAIASAILKELGITVYAYTKSIGPVTIEYQKCRKEFSMQNPLYMPDLEAAKKAEEYIMEKQAENDSVGGVIECIVTGMPPGIGEPVFDKLDAALAKAVMSIGAVKGVEIGDGFQVTTRTGSENNDPFAYDQNKRLIKLTNHAGGILGGLSDGSEIILRAAIKPTASIGRPQRTANKNNENIEIQIVGRHDPIIVPRAVVVVESMVAITLVDFLFQGMTARMDRIKEFYNLYKQ